MSKMTDTHVADMPSRRRLRAASTDQLLVPADYDWTKGVPNRWHACLERYSIWLFICSIARCLRTALEERTFSSLLQCCLTVTFFALIVVLEVDFLFRPL